MDRHRRRPVARVAPAEGIAFATVATWKIRRSARSVQDDVVGEHAVHGPGAARRGPGTQAGADFRPDVVFAIGGYVAVPAGLAAHMCRVPLVPHEQTVRLGLANRKLAGSATRIAVSSESTVPLLPPDVRGAAVVTGNPIRPEVLPGHADKAVQLSDFTASTGGCRPCMSRAAHRGLI